MRQFEHTRAVCWHIAAANRDPKKSFPTIERFWPLPTDQKTTEEITKDRAAEIRKKYEQARQMIERHNINTNGSKL